MAKENLAEKIRQIAGFGAAAKPALKPQVPRGARPEQTGKGTGADGRTKGGTGGGIASPLTETLYSDRKYHDEDISIPSSDGLFALVIKPLKSMKLKDASGAEVVINLAKP